MVNIPPIPPLLCSTPPPIDFGEEDEDIDIHPSLDNVEDDFGGFIVDDGLKTDEPLPSPRPPSVCDLPSISIYDGLILPEDEREEFTRHTKTSSLQSTNAKTNTKSKNVTEAFNFEVKNSTKDEKGELQDLNESPARSNKIAEYQEQQETGMENGSTEIQETQQSIQPVWSGGLNKNVTDLKIEPVNAEITGIVNKSNDVYIQNMVSIEDVENDLSDDELYSPKTPKNFVEIDHMTDMFKIEEIKPLTSAGNNLKTDASFIDTKSLESKDNNKAASLDNEDDNEYKSFSSNSFIRDQQCDKSPSLSEDLNNLENENDDDFGDFADFQETHFVNNAVPVKDIYINQAKTDLAINDFNGFNNYANFNNFHFDTNKVEQIKKANETIKQDFENSHSNSASLKDKFIDEGEKFVGKSEDLGVTMQSFKTDSLYTANENCNDYKNNNEKNENSQTVKQSNNEDNSLSDFSEADSVDDKEEDFGNFAEFSCVPSDCKNISVETIEKKEATSISNDNDDSDFADFESHQNVTNCEQAEHSSVRQAVNQDHIDDDDDDDFGDFNTAEPPTLTTSSPIVNNASHTIKTETPVVVASNNLNERISKILQLMFNPNLNLTDNDSNELKADKIQDIPFTSIDAAKALEYQWLNSDTRHSFIRSLGIDSRNILYGDNWNPLLPRFAANLSFNPLKPMKPLPSSNVTGNTTSILESIPISSSAEINRTIEISGSIKKETLDLDWESSIGEEQTIEAFKDNINQAPIDDSTSLPYKSNELQAVVPASLEIFENNLDNEGKLPKTPPISEMESITSFTTNLPAVAMDMELSTAAQTELEENTSSLNINEVIVTSTFTGSFKETHIYTPAKTNEFEIKHAITTPPTSSSSPTKSSPIDFDYEKAAMGVIIDETVVKKEYRDVEYNPPFTMDSLSKSVSPKMDFFESSNSYVNKNLRNSSLADKKEVDRDDEDANDDFSEFQSSASEVAVPATTKPLEVPKTITISHGGMILSPAILIPQAISLENQKPKIEWGDSTATINPEELARIEELFPEPKSLKSTSSSQKSTPTHQIASAPSISATVANKELERNINSINDDDDDWSDFVSVTVTNNSSANRTGSNNNVLTKSPAGTPFQQRSPIVTNKIPPTTTASNSNNDDEWSDFVSSAPPIQQPNTYRVPQFNSGAWQNANFYNNPLSMYHKGPININTTAAVTHSAHKYLYNNNNNYNVSQQQPYPLANNIPSTGMVNNHQPTHNCYKQQIHVMQNFSTAPVPTPERLSAAAVKNNQFQSIGSAKVAPSIALIPDLGFVAPAIPTHTSFINSLPKPSINMKK